MSANNNTPTSITPASLFSLAIYNPSLGLTDETLPDQICFWTSRVPLSQNDRLRQIGLAQGVVEFARGFSNRQDLNTVETQKSRIILHEIEPGWWILAYIDLTQIHYAGDPPTVEYSPREVAPSSVLLAQLLTSYHQFTFFHGTLDHVLQTHDRLGLVARLDRFYTRWAWRWEVMLSGNPATDVWSGIRVGRGVGAEEKEVLRGFIERNAKSKGGSTGGLVDMAVSRFGEPAESSDKPAEEVFSKNGTGRLSRPGDGCIYRGAGNISARSVRDVTQWMSDWARFGDDTFQFTSRSSSRRKKKKQNQGGGQHAGPDRRDPVERIRSPKPQAPPPPRRTPPPADAPKPQPASETSTPPESTSSLDVPGIPPRLPMQLAGDPPSNNASTAGDSSKAADSEATDSGGDGGKVSNTGKIMMDIFTFGTYSAWNRTRSTPIPSKPPTPEPFADGVQEPEEPTSQGRFVIGYTGDIEKEDDQELAAEDTNNTPPIAPRLPNLITKKAVWVERTDKDLDEVIGAPEEGGSQNEQLEQCTLVVYINHPFIFSLIFDGADPDLELPSFYRTLHYQLGPLREPLLASSQKQPGFAPSKGVFDLIFDPDGLTVHTSIPNIPEPRAATAIGGDRDLPRIEALHVHTQVVRIFEDTRLAGLEGEPAPNERERTNRTIRGWWIGWMKLEGIEVLPQAQPKLPPEQIGEGGEHVVMQRTTSQQSSQSRLSLPVLQSRSAGRREAFIIRKGTEHIRTHSRKSSSKEKMVPVTSGKLADGIGIDTKRYFEQLLNFAART